MSALESVSTLCRVIDLCGTRKLHIDDSLLKELLNLAHDLLILPFSSNNDPLSFELNPSYFRYFGAVSVANQ